MATGVSDFLSGKNVFVTGATGFVGMALVEKILRSAPDVGTIYLLVRPKRGKTPAQRLQDYGANSVFSLVRADSKGKSLLGKLVAVEGDVGSEELGLSENDRKTLINNVNVVFHSAATLDFEANLKTTVDINLLGTKRVLELCHEMKNIQAMVHVSSAYVNSHMSRAEERLYPIHKTSDEVVTLVKSLSDDELDKETPAILGEYLNTYTFTKALAEHEVAQANSTFPTVIVRPSMIVASWKEPMEAWTASKNGPQGFFMGALKGVVRRLPVDTSVVCDYIPVDLVVNTLLAGAWFVGTKRPEETPIFQATSSSYKPFKWSMVTDIMHTSLHRYPLKSAVWYPNLKFIPNMLWFKLTSILFHLLPAYILDFVTLVSGGRPILVRMHRNIAKSLDRLEPFIFTEWTFDNKKTIALHNALTSSDKQTFNLDLEGINWEVYFDNLTQGVRQYLHNESPATLPAARKKDNVLGLLNLALQGLFLVFVWWLFSVVTRSTLTETLWFFPLLAGVYTFI